ncbi:hypothetical protein HDU96_008356 [Phlyctochytrium bullatum]|nr:hypothetical protein HDU96_008356 [Phlyctochytrium bullatum]
MFLLSVLLVAATVATNANAQGQSPIPLPSVINPGPGAPLRPPPLEPENCFVIGPLNIGAANNVGTTTSFAACNDSCKAAGSKYFAIFQAGESTFTCYCPPAIYTSWTKSDSSCNFECQLGGVTGICGQDLDRLESISLYVYPVDSVPSGTGGTSPTRVGAGIISKLTQQTTLLPRPTQVTSPATSGTSVLTESPASSSSGATSAPASATSLSAGAATSKLLPTLPIAPSASGALASASSATVIGTSVATAPVPATTSRSGSASDVVISRTVYPIVAMLSFTFLI